MGHQINCLAAVRWYWNPDGSFRQGLEDYNRAFKTYFHYRCGGGEFDLYKVDATLKKQYSDYDSVNPRIYEPQKDITPPPSPKDPRRLTKGQLSNMVERFEEAENKR